MAKERHLTSKALQTKASLVEAAAAILREIGPFQVSYRKTAERAGAAPSSVGYYFDSIEDLLKDAAKFNMDLWVDRANEIADKFEGLSQEESLDALVTALLDVCIPTDLSTPVAHYQQLIGVSVSDAVIAEYRRGRILIDSVVQRILVHAEIGDANPRMVTSIIDGAAILAMSEGSDVWEVSKSILTEAFDFSLAHRKRLG